VEKNAKDPKSVEGSTSSGQKDDVGLGVAQIVITAATPMEEVEHPFPGVEETAGDRSRSGETEVIDGDTAEADPEASSAASDANENENECKEEETTVILDEKEEEEVEEKSTIDELPADSAPFPISSSSGSEAESTTSGPSTNGNSQSRGTVVEVTEEVSEVTEEEEVPSGGKMLIGGRASIPDELQPDQLEKLQTLKESNA